MVIFTIWKILCAKLWIILKVSCVYSIHFAIVFKTSLKSWYRCKLGTDFSSFQSILLGWNWGKRTFRTGGAALRKVSNYRSYIRDGYTIFMSRSPIFDLLKRRHKLNSFVIFKHFFLICVDYVNKTKLKWHVTWNSILWDNFL